MLKYNIFNSPSLCVKFVIKITNFMIILAVYCRALAQCMNVSYVAWQDYTIAQTGGFQVPLR
jgi:hypothetical protein